MLLAESAAGQQHAASAPSTTALAALRGEILAKETAVWEAAKQRDMETFKKLVAPDALMIFTSGVRTRAEYIASVDSRQIKSYSIDDFRVRSPSPNTAIAIYKATISGTFGGKEVPPTAVREASVWIKRGNRWVAVLNQETPLN
ncbi:MAG TPA: nuclear transport factor 2 family protein [Terriglobales bacterium]|nr:nuclear transport factor 2 family protein [Terriglobales bacterium]